jgi:hypothetical protein
VWRHDRTRQDVTLVPFRGKTLAAGTGFTEIVDVDDNQQDAQEIERLGYQLMQCFPELESRDYGILTCIKAEHPPGGKVNVNPQIYGLKSHGVNGLIVALPGKASFMFDVATSVGEYIYASLKR